MLPEISAWAPYCGSEYGFETDETTGKPLNNHVAGDPVICDRPNHTELTKHKNSNLGFEWWGE